MLFTDRSIWTMVHGIGLGGTALMGLSAALFYLYAARSSEGAVARPGGRERWPALTVLTRRDALAHRTSMGTYGIFPAYRATPPPGLTDLSEFPRALDSGEPDTAWLHAFAMESKEHVPWIASMLTTAVAFVTVRYRSRVLQILLAESVDGSAGDLFALVAFVSLMGIFVNKVAPLQ